MTSAKTNTTILYIVLLIVGTIQITLVTKQIYTDWSVSNNLRRILLVLRFCLNAGFLIIFSVKLKRLITINNSGSKAIEV